MTYAMPSENITGFLDFVIYENNILDGLLGWGLLILIWVVIFSVLKIYSSEQAFIAASFITMIVSILFYISGLIGIAPVIVAILLVGIGAIMALLLD